MKIAGVAFLAGLVAMPLASLQAQTQPNTAAPPLGPVARAEKAHIGEPALTVGATIYSGDYVSTEDGGALLIRIGGLSLELRGSSAAHLYRTPYGAIAELNRGTAIYNTPGRHENLVIVASDVRVTPVLSVADIGRVTINDPCNVTVASQRGQADVRVGSESHNVEEGKDYRVHTLNEVSYHQWVSPDVDNYHEYRNQSPVPRLTWPKAVPPLLPGQADSCWRRVSSPVVSRPGVSRKRWRVRPALKRR
jgi:hypothetical protein